jgi:hypothetical protein
MMSLVRSASSALDALASLDALRESLHSCKASAPERLRPALLDAYDSVCRIQSELAGGPARVPLSAVEALGLLRAGLDAPASGDFSSDCGIAAGRARRVLERLPEGERRISITSENYLRRLVQLFTALAAPHHRWQR